MTARLRARAHTSGDAGLSLVEVLVTMVVLGIVMGIVTPLSVQIITITADARSSRAAVGTASSAMSAMTKVLRQAGPVPTSPTATLSAVTAASATSVTVSSWVDTSATTPLPSSVTYSTSSSRLVETRTTGTLSGAYYAISGTPTSRTLALPIAVTFAYRDGAGAAVTAFNSTTLRTIRSITISVTVANTTRRVSDPFVLTNAVVLQNAALQDQVGS